MLGADATARRSEDASVDGDEQIAPGDQASPEAEGTGENLCPDCQGRGRSESGQPCPTCGGTGRVVEGIGGG
jgi:DnaJ-class molecular chaperone